MTPDEFRRWGKELIDWIADYHETVETMRVLPAVKPGDIRAALPDRAPDEPEPFERIRADLDSIVLPGLTNWQSPYWFAYFPGNASFPAILGELISAGVGQQGMLWSTSPAATEIESHVLDWLVDLLGLPQTWKTTSTGGGVIQLSASDSTHTALVVARHMAGGPIDDLAVYVSAQAHSSIEKGARVAGFRHIRLIDVDDLYALRPEALEAAITGDRAAGLTPAFVCSAVGTTGTTAVDPVRRIGEIARREGLWHHVDAAFAGSAMICEEFRHHQDGLELVDSYTFNPHKWMLTNFDCSLFYVADRTRLIEALSILPPILRNQASESGEVIDYRDWHVPLGRRFRALKLWFVLRSFGAEGIRAFIRHHVEIARELADRLAADERFELVAPVPFSLVCFRHVAGDTPTDALATAINEEGPAYLTPSKLPDGSSFIRVSIGQTNTRRRHVEELWHQIDRLASRQ